MSRPVAWLTPCVVDMRVHVTVCEFAGVDVRPTLYRHCQANESLLDAVDKI